MRYLASDPTWRTRDPLEVSASYGLMQIMYTTALEVGFHGEPWDLFRPEVNLDLGCAYLARLVARARGQWVTPGDGETTILRAALASYNGGGRGNEADAAPDRNAAYASAVLARLPAIRAARGGGSAA